MPSQNSQYYSDCNSQYSSQSATYVVKKDNEEAMIMTQQQSGCSNSKHRRGSNMHIVLEDISNGSASGSNRNSSKSGKGKMQMKRHSKGKENKIGGLEGNFLSRQKRSIDVPEIKSHSFAGGAIRSKADPHRSHKAIGLRQQDLYDEEDDGLEIRFVNDIESLVPPRYNPDTRTYFKCSIYSPSNRLYTVNEEVNSTYSDNGLGEGFSSSARNSAYRITHGKTRIPSQSQKKVKSGEFSKRGSSSNEK